MNPVLSLRADRNFAQLFPELVSRIVNVVGGGDGAHDFHQLHQRHGIEKVQSDEPLGALWSQSTAR